MTVLIPAYEPDARMTQLIRRLKEGCDYKILIVDDGSGPAYRPLFEEAKAMGCTVLYADVNMGKGAALKRGFAYLAAFRDDGTEPRETEGVVCADCDGQHTVKDILRLAQAALENPGVMVLGKRDFSGSTRGVPIRSMIGNTVTRISFALIVGVRVYDVNTGLRAYSADMMSSLCNVKGDRFEYEMNLLTQCRKEGYHVLELPIDTVYERETHTSHFRTLADTARVSGALAMFIMGSLIAFAVDLSIYFTIMRVYFGYELSTPDEDLPILHLLTAVVAARVVSAVINYLFNRRYVFGKGGRSAPVKYAVLALSVLGINYAVQVFLIKGLGWPVMPTKLTTEALLFAVSYATQRMIVFGGKRREARI